MIQKLQKTYVQTENMQKINKICSKSKQNGEGRLGTGKTWDILDCAWLVELVQ